MYLLTLHNGQRALYRGRHAENCFYVRMQGERYWWWIPRGMVARALELPDPARAAAA
ncbi:MAG: hypothetical protein QF561_02105 [Phycisphaerales bacterium]|jgi:hypothetical protein|nr:hypothetical protein [Phycisphaerales bacterium]